MFTWNEIRSISYDAADNNRISQPRFWPDMPTDLVIVAACES